MTKEEKDLWNKAKTDITTRNQLIEDNLKLVKFIANKYLNLGLDYEDLVHEGLLGLILAIERFEPEKGCAFSTFAGLLIRQAMSKAIDDQTRTIKVPSDVVIKYNRSYDFINQTYQLTGLPPSIKEIANKFQISEKKAEELLTTPMFTESLNNIVSSFESETEFIDFITYDEPTLEETFLENIDQTLIPQLLVILNEREQQILKLRCGFFGKIYTLDELVPYFKISRERIRQIEKNALKKLHKHCEAQNLTFKLSNNYYGF